jgi:hypothetical protein
MKVTKAAIIAAGIATVSTLGHGIKDSIIGDVGVKIGEQTGLSNKLAGAIIYPFKKMGDLFKSKPTLMDKGLSMIQKPHYIAGAALTLAGLFTIGKIFPDKKPNNDDSDIQMQHLGNK